MQRPVLSVSAEQKRYLDLRDEVEEKDGVLNVNMGRLRDVHGAGKLGNIVVESIAERLKSVGLGYTPKELPTAQWKQVLIYKIGTPAGRLINAINDVDDDSADIILKFVNSATNADTAIVQKIRELVCD